MCAFIIVVAYVTNAKTTCP